MKEKVIIHTDGSCHYKTGKGGIGIVIQHPNHDRQEIYEGFNNTTNNRMELMAVICALELLPPYFQIDLYSDSQYIVKCINGQYAIRKNEDLWERFFQALKIHGRQHFNIRWVRGHNGDPMNELADQLAKIGYDISPQESIPDQITNGNKKPESITT